MSCLSLSLSTHLSFLFPDFSDRISKSRRVGYESGEFEIVSIFCSAEEHYFVLTKRLFILFTLVFVISDKSQRACDASGVIISLSSFVYWVIFIQFLCGLARRGLWSEGDASAEVSAPSEWDPGTHAGGGHHPGNLQATDVYTRPKERVRDDHSSTCILMLVAFLHIAHRSFSIAFIEGKINHWVGTISANLIQSLIWWIPEC